MSAQIIELNIRPAKIVLDWVHNPAGNGDWALNSAQDFEEGAGIIPDFFADAVQGAQTLEDVAERMDDIYQNGGFRYPFQGHVDEEGIYHSAQGDPALFPLVRLKGGEHNRFTCYVYEYGITAIQDDKLPGEAMIARFD